MATGKITEFIDERAFQQFVMLKDNLSTSQAEFEKLADTARKFNDEMAKAKSIRDLAGSYEDAQGKINALTDSLKRQEKEMKAMKSAYDELIRVSTNSTDVVLAQRDSMEDLVKAQVRLKNDISDTNWAIKKQAEMYEKGKYPSRNTWIQPPSCKHT